MTDIPAHLLTRPRRLHNTELSLTNAIFAGGGTEDDDIKQLMKIRKVTKIRIDKKKNTII